jgi:hypothetical protein
VEQVRHYLAAQQGGSLGLVVYLVEPTDEDLRRALPGAWFPVLMISMQDLIEQLRPQSFAGVVRDCATAPSVNGFADDVDRP